MHVRAHRLSSAGVDDSLDAQAPALKLPFGQALALGFLHGPAELLPVSSSAHTLLVGYLAGWRYEQLDGPERKSFELALHAGTAGALVLVYRRLLARKLRELKARQLGMLGLALAPPALAGYFLEDQIEQRLSDPAPIAGGLLLGSAAMALADRRGRCDRDAGQAGPLDGLALGLAQALALAPGISRNGATLAAARARGFDPASAQRLSWQVGLPVITGASMLRGIRLARSPHTDRDRRVLTVGAVSAFISSWLLARLMDPVRTPRSLMPLCVYRAGLSVLVLATLARRRGAARDSNAEPVRSEHPERSAGGPARRNWCASASSQSRRGSPATPGR